MSQKIDIKIEGLDELIRDMKKAGMNAEPLVTAALTNSASHTQQQMRQRAPHAFGTLQRSILPEVNYPEAEVAANVEYAAAVETGTQPHRPPHDAIQRWAAKKGLPKGVSFAIVKSIQKKGTRPQPFFLPGWEASQEYIESQFTKVMDRMINIIITGRSF